MQNDNGKIFDTNPIPCSQLLNKHKSDNNVISTRKLNFPEEYVCDVYNITAPFIYKGEKCIAGRVEKRDSEDSCVKFFRKNDGAWIHINTKQEFLLQDPFVTYVDNELILGGVETIKDSESGKIVSWRTVFYRGNDFDTLEKFLIGPEGMKDIRLKQLSDGRIFVFTRPQGEKGGLGKIGYGIYKSFDEITGEKLENLPLISTHFTEGEWGGVNEIHLIGEDWLGVLAHIACYSTNGNRHYYATTFAMNYQTGKRTNMKIIACRDDFLEGEAKRSDLIDVIFSGGIVRNSDGTASLYCGVSDAESHTILIKDPFIEYEKQIHSF